MKHCPTCSASYAEEDVFCELDGARLEGDTPPVSVSPAAESAPTLPSFPPLSLGLGLRHAESLVAEGPKVPVVSCPACGAASADDGEGYCMSCGHRLDARPTVSVLPLGATLGGHTVTGPRSVDDVLAVTAAGEQVAIAMGDPMFLEAEATMARALAGRAGVPRVLASGDDPRRGGFLVLSHLPGDVRPLAEAGPDLAPADALLLARQALALTEAVFAAGFSWVPREDDFYLSPGGGIVLARVRVRAFAAAGAHVVDASYPVAAMGRALVPQPAFAGPPRLVRLLSGSGVASVTPAYDAATMRAELDAAERELHADAKEIGLLASECDPGLKRPHNEDAVATASGQTKGEPWAVLVVCDGVSCSSHAEQASSVAAKTACDTLAHFARSGDITYEAATSAMAAAIRAAHVAVCTAQIASDNERAEPPGTTIVAGLVYRRRLTVGWVGDSRAYWVGQNGSELLTRDHSWAIETVARGEMTEEQAMRQPLAHALTRCLGPLESNGVTVDVEPEVRARDLPGPGYVVLCSDGLWNYFPEAHAVAELVRDAGPGASCRRIAQHLVNHALLKGGGDNVTVAVLAHGM